MAWKLATAFVLTTESWLGPERTHSGEEAVLSIGVSRHERLGVIRRVRKTPGVEFAPPEWLPADAFDENYFRLLPFVDFEEGAGRMRAPRLVARRVTLDLDLIGPGSVVSVCPEVR
jgi:hypothetical protein